MQRLISDLRWSVRLLFKSPGFTIAALLSLSVGIGITTLVFTFASGAFLRTIAVPDPERLVHIYAGRPTFAEYLALRDQVGDQINLVVSTGGSSVFFTDTDSGSARILTVSDNYFEAVGLTPSAGRLGTVDQGQPTTGTCVISHQLWSSRFGASHDAIGKIIRLGNAKLAITGVGPRDFRGTDLRPVDIWLPLTSSHRDSEKMRWELSGRLRPGVSVAQARAALEQTYRAFGIGASDAGGDSRVGVQSVAERHRIMYAPVTFFTGLGFLVLLVGCANVAGLLSTRSVERRTEIAVRLALGSHRSRLIRLLLTESALLAALAGGVGLLFTCVLLISVKPWLPRDLLGVALDEVTIDVRVLAATIALAAIATLVAGLLPAWRASRTDLVSAMKGNALMGVPLNPRVSLRKVLVVLQLAVSFAFICIGGLFMRSMSVPKVSDLQSDRLLVVDLFAVQNGSEPKVLHEMVLETLKDVPGVDEVTTASSPPLFTYDRTAVRTANDRSRSAVGGALMISARSNYFETTGTPLVRGRSFFDRAPAGSGPEVVVSEAMARRFWPDADPLGNPVVLGDANSPACIVVGIAKDVVAGDASLYERRSEPVVYVPAYSSVAPMSGQAFALLKMHGPAASFIPEVRKSLLRLPVFAQQPPCESLETRLAGYYRPQQCGALFALVLGLLAAGLAAFGLYSVTSSMVVARTREIGIRAALGATVSDTVGLFLRQGARLAVWGIGLGVPLAWGAARILRSGMFGIVPVDVSTLTVSAVAVAVATLAASYLPARRAARIDPINALRTE